MVSTLYARYEPTTDGATRDMNRQSPGFANPQRQRDVVIYADREATRVIGRFPWHHSDKPTPRQRKVTINCCNHPIEWLPDLEAV